MPSPATPYQPDATTRGPSAPWLAFGFLLAGLGTVILGNILPVIIANWHLTDSQTGPLFFAKFTGAFIGGISVPRRLRLGILSGTILCCLGFGAFAFCHNLLPGSLTLFLGGIGLGQIIASTNILAGHRYTAHTGSALASLNFFWSLGAVATGLIVGSLMPHFGLRNLLLYLAAAFLIAGLGGALTWTLKSPGGPFMRSTLRMSGEPQQPGAPDLSHLEIGVSSVPETSNLKPETFPRNALFLFATLLFLYGGLETCLTGWLTTYTVRYSDEHLLAGQSATVLLWTALTVGRALASIALRYIREATMQRLGLALSFLFIAALALTHRALPLSICCILLGLALAPFFPATFALLIRRNPTPRQAGFVLAVSGLGAAAFPWLMGIVSTYTGSLRTAMAVPMALALLLLAAGFAPGVEPSHSANAAI